MHFTSKELITNQEVRWCPGCGDYSILKQVQTILPELDIPKEDIVFISGIGCSSRFPYYMDTYGMHSIHGRATTIATGLKITRPELSVWIVTGDGDALSIGGNHFIHLLRRNVDVNVLLFNNEIYGLTKGQYSPTSEVGKITKSTPYGSLDSPFNPLELAQGAGASFLARTMDRDPAHMRSILKQANDHTGTSLIEIYQNCNVFNDSAFEVFTEKNNKALTTLFLEHGKALLFGNEEEKAIVLHGLTPVIKNTAEINEAEIWIHDQYDKTKAFLLNQMFATVTPENGFMPRPFGVLYQDPTAATYDELVKTQMQNVLESKGKGDLDSLLAGKSTWEVMA